MKSLFFRGLGTRLRRYWPAVMVVCLAVVLVTMTLLAAATMSRSLEADLNRKLGPEHIFIDRTWSTDGLDFTQATILDQDDVVAVGIHPVSRPIVATAAGLEPGLDPGGWQGQGPDSLETLESDYFRDYKLEAGNWPTRANQVVVNSPDRLWRIGDSVVFSDYWDEGPQQVVEVVGLIEFDQFRFDRPTNSDQATFIGLPELVAGAGLDRPGSIEPNGDSFATAWPNDYGHLLVASINDVGQIDSVVERLAADLGSDYFVYPVGEIERLAIEAITTSALIVGGNFVLVAIAVAVYVTINVFMIIVGRMARELALLRLNGATRSAIWWRTILDSLSLGIIAAAFGIGLSLALAGLLLFGLNQFTGLELVWPGLIWWHFLVAALVGVTTAVLAAIRPAIWASWRPPLAAIAPVESSPWKSARVRVLIGIPLTVFGMLMLLLGVRFLNGNLNILLVPAGLIFLGGLAILTAGLARPFGNLLALIGRPLQGLSWRLATINIGRDPGRSAAVANSILIGVCLISLVTVLASSAKLSSGQMIDHYFPAEWLISEDFDGGTDDWWYQLGQENTGNQVSPMMQTQIIESGLLVETTVIRQVAAEEVDRTWSAGYNFDHSGSDLETATDQPGPASLFEPQSLIVAGVDHQTIASNINLSFRGRGDSDLETTLAAGEVLLNRYTYSYPDQIESIELMIDDQPREYKIGGSFRDDYFDIIISNDLYAQVVDDQTALMIVGQSPEMIDGAEASADRIRAGLESIIAADSDLAVYSVRDDFVRLIEGTIDIVLNVFRGLLGLSLLVAVLGIFCTLILAVNGRRREIGLLRSLGLSQRATQMMVAFEGLAMALFGVVLGISAGLFFAWLFWWKLRLSVAGADDLTDAAFAEFINFSLPWGQLGVYCLLAMIVGLVAALIPALLASRRPIIDCLNDPDS